MTKPFNDGTPAHANDDVLYSNATWYEYGVSDGQQSAPRRVLTAPFDIYQQAYDDGFNQGVWNAKIIDPEYMS